MTPLNLVTPLIGLLDCLNNDYRDPLTATSDSSEDIIRSNFGILLIRCMHCLLKECRVREPVQYILAIGIPLALKDRMDNITNREIQIESSTILKNLFVHTPNLFSRALYQLCIPPSRGASLEVLHREVSSSDSEVIILLESKMNRCQRLHLVADIIKMAQNEDSLRMKVRKLQHHISAYQFHNQRTDTNSNMISACGS